MVEVTVRYDDPIDGTVVDVAPKLRKRTGAKVDHDVGRPALDEVAAAPLSWVRAGGTASQYREFHLFPYLSVSALHALGDPIVTEAERLEIFDDVLSRHL
jgi:hypothetical protein